MQGPGWWGRCPAPALPALLCCPLPKRRHRSVSPPDDFFPSSRVGLCHGEPAYGVSECALIGGESVLKCHRKIYTAAQPLQVLIVL